MCDCVCLNVSVKKKQKERQIDRKSENDTPSVYKEPPKKNDYGLNDNFRNTDSCYLNALSKHWKNAKRNKNEYLSI